MEITLGSSSLKNASAASLAYAVVPSSFVFRGEIGQVAHVGNGEEGLTGLPYLACIKLEITFSPLE